MCDPQDEDSLSDNGVDDTPIAYTKGIKTLELSLERLVLAGIRGQVGIDGVKNPDGDFSIEMRQILPYRSLVADLSFHNRFGILPR